MSELSSEANGTYSGEFGNAISFQDMDGNDFRGLVWSARSIFHTDNTYVAFSVSPKAGEIIKVDSVSLSLGVRSFINQTTTAYDLEIKSSKDGFKSVMATYNSKAKLDSKGFDYKDDVFVALSRPILISNKTEFRIFVKTAENGSHNGLFS